MDFLKNLKLDDHKAEEQHAPAHVQKPESGGLLGKLAGALNDFDKSTTNTPPPSAVPKASESGHGGLFDKIGDVVSGKPTPAPAPPAPAQKESLFDKIGDAITGHKTPPPPPPPQGLFGKLESVISGKPQEPVKAQGFSGKLNEVLGGGAKGEAKETKLDKAIDLFQEHVLKEGPQHHESALEQAKDKQIADTIRKTLNIPEKK